MVLVIVAVIWVAALLPPFVRSRLEGNPIDSIGRFRRHLRVLECTSPAASSLANDPVMALVSGPAAFNTMPATWANEARRLRRLRRRRQVALLLLAVMGSTLAIGLVPGLHAVLALHAVADLAGVAYVALLVKARALATERQMAAHFAALAVDPVGPADLGDRYEVGAASIGRS